MSRRRADEHCDISLLHWSQYLDGEFSTAACRRCEAHLAECPACRARLRDVRHTVRACRTAGRIALPQEVRSRARKRTQALLAGKAKGR
ncbi:MAG: anti-sigma factor [Vicinamibacterales bacterium]